MALSSTTADALLDALLGDGHLASQPATLYLALSTTDPTSSITEPAVGGYARALVPNNTVNWPAASGGSKANAAVLLFPQATADYPQVGWWALMDATTAGNMVASGALAAPVTVANGTQPRFPVGSLIVTLG
jgi:hypothetical protein